MIFTDRAPVTFQDALPKSAEVVVIGAGVIGISTAWYLSQAGIKVMVCEKGRVAGEQSSRNWGWVRQQGRDPAELPIMMESNRIWQNLSQAIGADTGFEQHGVMYVGETEADEVAHDNWMALAKSHDLHSERLTSAQITQRVPGFVGNWKSGVCTPSDGRAEPFVVVPAMAKSCRDKGVSIREDCAVRGLLISAGRVSGVATEAGEIRCKTVVCAGGAWSSLFAGINGIVFPQLSVKSTVARTAAAPDFHSGNFACDRIAIRRRQDGGYTIAPAGFNEHEINLDSVRYLRDFLPVMWQEVFASRSLGKTRLRIGSGNPGGLIPKRKVDLDQISPFEKQRVLNPLPNQSTTKRMRRYLSQRLPALAEVPWVEEWAGMIDVTPDIVPVMDQVSEIPGFFLASGFCGHGFGIGPAAGRIMSDMIQGNTIGHDLSRFRFSRFQDGSTLTQGPTI
ncbi:MAG: FAD-binding oxidoreductase [Acidiferrobacterales bacterium]|nr:FAD-binding oxidoreductase [Acidiferrobacterales bacterium]